MPIERGGGRRGGPGVIAAPGKARIGAPRALDPAFNTNSMILRSRNNGYLNMLLSGVSRDNTGAALGSCRVMVFRTEDNSFVAETTSDASGVWSISLNKGGPFFLVEYKTGLAGTSLNTLVPVSG